MAAASAGATLPGGVGQDVKFYGQNYSFTLYALRPGNGPNPNEQTFTAVASASFSGSAATPVLQTLPVWGLQVNGRLGFLVQAGDLLASAGIEDVLHAVLLPQVRRWLNEILRFALLGWRINESTASS